MKLNVLITSAGRRVSLLQSFRRSSQKKELAVSIYAADLNPELSPACRIADASFSLPPINSINYLEALLNLCQDQQITMVIPTIDTELAVLAKARSDFKAYGIELLVSDLDFVTVCRDKRLTSSFFEEHGFRVPKPITLPTDLFPIFIKPIDGSSSTDIHLIRDASMLSQHLSNTDTFMHNEYLDQKLHTEYTIDMYYDARGTLRCLVPRIRMATRGGEVSKGITARDHVYGEVRRLLHYIPGARGCITLQVFSNNETHNLFGIEINPRFGGGYPLSYEAGADFPSMIFEEHFLGKSLEFQDLWEEDLMTLRYDAEYFIRGYQL